MKKCSTRVTTLLWFCERFGQSSIEIQGNLGAYIRKNSIFVASSTKSITCHSHQFKVDDVELGIFEEDVRELYHQVHEFGGLLVSIVDHLNLAERQAI